MSINKVKSILTSKDQDKLYFFDIYEWSISLELFQKLSANPNIFVMKENDSIEKLGGHSKYLFCHEPKIDITKSKVRVSCSALVKIIYEDKVLLLIEDDKIKPVGGAYTFIKLPDIKSLKKEKKDSMDLRVFMDIKELPVFSNWFYSEIGRETTPFREIIEELVFENDILEISDLVL